MTATAGGWPPYCSACKNRCREIVTDHGFDYQGPQGWASRDDYRDESDCCEADVLTGTPDCTRCDSSLSDDEPVYWTPGSLLCEDCHNGVPLDG